MTTVNGESMIPNKSYTGSSYLTDSSSTMPREKPMNSPVNEAEIIAAYTKFKLNSFRPGKKRDTKKKLNRGIRENRRIMTRDSRRANR